MSNLIVKQVAGALGGLLAAGVEQREAIELIERVPGWLEAWDYGVDMDNGIEILDLTDDAYVEYVTGLYGSDPERVARVYRELYPESHCWGLAEEDAVAELAEQDVRDGWDARAFRDGYAHDTAVRVGA